MKEPETITAIVSVSAAESHLEIVKPVKFTFSGVVTVTCRLDTPGYLKTR